MRVLLATYGTRGDVQPIVALALRLRARDVDVRVCAPPDQEFADLLARHDVALLPFREPWHPPTTTSTNAEDTVVDVDSFVAGYIDATFGPMLSAAAGCDVLLATGMTHFVAGSVAELTGVRHRFALFAPVLDAPERDARVRRPIDAHRASIGLPPVGDVRTYLFTDRPWVAVEPVLCPWRAPDGFDVVWTTAWLLPDRRPLPADVVAFLGAGSPPAYVGFGSMRVDPQIVHAALGAARDRGLRVLLHRGRSTMPPPTDDGDDVLVIGDVNQQALFPRVAVAVHHGGAGTTTAAARAGVPQLVLPQAADQPDWAARIAELGIGAALSDPTDESLAAAFDTALSPHARARAGAVAATMGDDGADTAAAMLIAAGDETGPGDRT